MSEPRSEYVPFRCPASISGTCLNMTQGWAICPPDECDLTPVEADESGRDQQAAR